MTIRTTTALGLLVATLAALTLALIAATAHPASADVAAQAARNCSRPKYPGDGYFTSLSVRGTSCRTGKRFVIAYYRCRVRNGGKDGRCNRRVFDFKCTERRNRISTEIDARVTCRRGSRRIVHTYQQNL